MIWVTFSAIIVGLTLLQTITGKLESITAFGWWWVCVNLIPGLLVLFIAVLLDRQTTNSIPGFVHRSLWMGALIYLSLVLITLLAEQAAISGSLSIKAYRSYSFGWLIPFQGLLLIGFYLVFFRAKPLFFPDEKTIVTIADKQAKLWREKQNQLREECFRLITAGRVGEVFDKISNSIKKNGAGDLDRLILLKNQFVENRRNIDLNLVSLDEGSRVQSRVIMALMNMINQSMV